MNEYSDSNNSNNVKILVRIRSHPLDKDKFNDTEASVRRNDNTPPHNKSTSSSFTNQKAEKKSTTAKPRSKSPVLKTSTPIIKQISLNDSQKYTIFTSTSPSNTVVITNKAISGKLINETFSNTSDLYEYSYSIIKDATLLEYDKVYNETHKLDVLYNEQVKESIGNLFLGRNSSVFLFGPSDSGKSFTLRGGSDGSSNEIGVLGRAMQDLFNLVEISKQANLNTKGKGSTYFAVKMSVYQVYLDGVSDLLTNQFNKNLKIEKYYDSENTLSSQILELTQKEVRNKKDYDNLIKEAMQFRKLLTQTLKVNELKRKSHLVISIFLEKREKVNEGHNKTAEKTIDRFSQIDFVELAASNYGLADLNIPKKSDSEQWEDPLYKNTSKVFDSISNNILSSAIGVGVTPKIESKLTLALKNTMRSDSMIIFISCVLPFEEPPVSSFKCLKFTNWLRNQVHNVNENRDRDRERDNKERCKYDDESEEEESPVGDNINNNYNNNNNSGVRRHVRNNSKGNSKYASSNNADRDYNYSTTITNYQTQSNNKGYLEDGGDSQNQNHKGKVQGNYHTIGNYEKEIHSSNDEQEIRQLRERMNKKYPYTSQDYSNSNSNLNQVTRPLNKLHKDVNLLNKDGTMLIDQSYLSSNINPHQPKEEKLKEVEKSLRDLEAKSVEMSRCIENMRMDRSRLPEDSQHMIRTTQTINYDDERAKQENATLKSDNIIFREDINRLSDVNRHLEDELTRQRNRNLELASENERIAQEKMAMKAEIDKLNENVSRVKVQEHNYMDQMNQRFLFENKMREVETENKTLREEKQKFEVEFRVLSERHNELKKHFEQTDSELNFIKIKQGEEVDMIENKLEKMAKEIEFLQRENNNLRVNEERLRSEVINLEKQRDNYRDKYQDHKGKNNILSVKLNEIEDDFRKIMLEKQVECYEKKKDEETKKVKVDSKHKILEDMQSRISSYKTELMRQRNKKEDF